MLFKLAGIATSLAITALLSGCKPEAKAAVETTGCPTSADIDRGFVAELSQKYGTMHMRMQRIDDTLMWGSSGIAGSRKMPWHVTFYRGLLRLKEERPNGSDPTIFDHATDLSKLFPLRVGKTHHLKGTRTDARNGTYPFELKLEVVGEESYAIGDCSYPVKRVRLHYRYKMPDGKTKQNTQQRLYSPDLNFNIWTRFGGSSHDYTAIRKRWAADEFPR